MNFHLGKPILVMLVIALVAGGGAFRPEQEKADLILWVFADSHYKSYQPLIPEFERKHNVKVNLNMSTAAPGIRLTSLFMADKEDHGDAGPGGGRDRLVGRFFRPPVDQIGFLPLNDRLEESGLLDRSSSAASRRGPRRA